MNVSSSSRSTFVYLLGCAVFVLFSVFAGVAVSQESPPAETEQVQQEQAEQPTGGEVAVGEAVEHKKEKNIFEKILEAYVVGDWPMHFILLFFILILALSIERMIAVYFTYGKDPAKLFDDVKRAYEEGGIDRAIEFAQNNLKYPTASIFYSVLRVLKETNPSNTDEKELKELMNSAAEEEFLRASHKIQRRIPLIHIFANTAVLLGLLGAVVGLIEAFAGVGALDPAQRQIYLSRSISIVMHSTAFGLIVAITGVVLFAIISSKANNLVAAIEEYAVRTVNWTYLMHMARNKESEREKKGR